MILFIQRDTVHGPWYVFMCKDIRPHQRTKVKTFKQIEKLKTIEDRRVANQSIQVEDDAADTPKKSRKTGDGERNSAKKGGSADNGAAGGTRVLVNVGPITIVNGNLSGAAKEIDPVLIMWGHSQKLQVQGVLINILKLLAH